MTCGFKARVTITYTYDQQLNTLSWSLPAPDQTAATLAGKARPPLWVKNQLALMPCSTLSSTLCS
jgi:hypothetical protein